MNYIGTCYSPVVRETPGPSHILTSFLACRLLRVDGYYCSSQADRNHFAWVLRLALFADPPQFPEPLGRLKHPRSFKVQGPGNHILKPGRMADYLACRLASQLQRHCWFGMDINRVYSFFKKAPRVLKSLNQFVWLIEFTWLCHLWRFSLLLEPLRSQNPWY